MRNFFVMNYKPQKLEDGYFEQVFFVLECEITEYDLS